MPQRVLIVEDDESTRTGLIELLTRAGYAAQGAATLQDARRMVNERAPDLLIADVRLGGFNGLQLLVTRATPIPTIIVTEFVDPVLEAEARRRGAHYITKPISPAHLLGLVDQMLAAASRGEMYRPSRRWSRKKVSGPLRADVDGSPARVIDVSYGGLRFEVERPPDRALPRSFSVTLPNSLSLKVELVWRSPSSDRTVMCGAALSQGNQAAVRAW